jgi:creatinine amidohydrolase
MSFLPLTTSADEQASGPDVALLPVGSFEQHGSHLPLSTDTLIACILTEAVGRNYLSLVLPPITVSCSHEHAGFAGTVSIESSTLTQLIADIRASLAAQGIERLVIVNGHGGNYVLNNIAQQANVDGPKVVLYPSPADWDSARRAAGLVTTAHDDMHGGEGETSILLHFAPSSVRETWRTADHDASERADLLTLGMRGYTSTGIIGRPSLASAEKGERLVQALVAGIAPHLAHLGQSPLRLAQLPAPADYR